ncbi:unnamed protein product, partial [Timema podura]|nr:unnamed protein product [Timema podura]
MWLMLPQENLSALETEKRSILKTLEQSESQNSRLSQVTRKLQVTLRGIEDETLSLLEEKEDIENRYQENELRAKVLEEEKQIISQQSSHLLSSLNDLLSQKDLAESELRLEVSARLEAENRLKSAQDSVQHLEGALQTDISPSALRNKILPDVKKLRSKCWVHFFKIHSHNTSCFLSGYKALVAAWSEQLLFNILDFQKNKIE